MDILQKYKQNKHEPSTSRKLVISMNILFLLITLGICCTGALLRFGETVWRKKFENIMKTLSVEDMDFSTLKFDRMFSMAGTILIGVGLGAVFLCIVGFVSTSKRSFILSLLYTIKLSCIILIQIIIFGIIGIKRSFVDNLVKPPLVADVTGFRGYNGTDSVSQTWGFLMVTFSCCGVDGYGDFRSAVHWNRRVYQEGWWFVMDTPLPCCKMRLRQQGDFSCAVNPNDANSNFENGCYDAVLNSASQYRVFIIAGLVLLATFEFTLWVSNIVFTVEVYKKGKETKKSVEDSSTNDQRQNDVNEYYQENFRTAANNQDNIVFPYPNRFPGSSGHRFAFDGPVSNMFPGYKPSMGAPFGMPSLLHSMQTMPGFGFPMFGQHRPRYFGDVDPIFTQHDQGLTSVGISRTSGPVIVQVPAITAPSERRQSAGSIDGLTIEDITDTGTLPALQSGGLQSPTNPMIRRQNTAPVSTDEPAPTIRRQNTWQPRTFMQRKNVLQRQNTVNLPSQHNCSGIEETTCTKVDPSKRYLSRANTCATVETDLLNQATDICEDNVNEIQDRNRSETF